MAAVGFVLLYNGWLKRAASKYSTVLRLQKKSRRRPPQTKPAQLAYINKSHNH
uniref:Uncharacterized protein n=1 Tax=Anguilla anguilla TaxID=7936 RepID=A0A0E9PRJ1_ANGAN